MAKLKSSRSTLIVAALIVGGAMLYVFYFYLPTRTKIAELQTEIEQKQQFIEMTESLVPIIAKTEKKIAAERAFVKSWNETAPSEDKVSEVFAQITHKTKQAGVKTTRFDPQPVEQLQALRKIPLALSVTGPYSRILATLASLERMPQTIWLENLQLEAPRQDGEHAQCEATLVIFANNSEKSD